MEITAIDDSFLWGMASEWASELVSIPCPLCRFWEWFWGLGGWGNSSPCNSRWSGTAVQGVPQVAQAQLTYHLELVVLAVQVGVLGRPGTALDGDQGEEL